jgi:hypothetical protein
LEALVAVDGGADLVIRKREAILRREILQAFHFAEFQEGGRFFHGGFVFRFAGGLEGLQRGEVLLDGPVDALFVKGEELESFRFSGEDVGGGEGGVKFGEIGAGLSAILKLAEGEDVVFNRTDPVETPTVRRNALGDLDFHGSLGCEVFHESLGEFVVGGAVLVSHGGDLTGDTVTARVEAGALLALFRGTRGQKSVGAVCFELFIGDHSFFSTESYHGESGNRGREGVGAGWGAPLACCRDWGCGDFGFIFLGCD